MPLQVSSTRLSVKIALISYWNEFSLIPLGKCASLKDRYEKMQTIQILKILRAPPIQNKGSMPLKGSF